ncbi:hypothetical protein AVEN_81171-1, partial [Araneus ventricosus]
VRAKLYRNVHSGYNALELEDSEIKPDSTEQSALYVALAHVKSDFKGQMSSGWYGSLERGVLAQMLLLPSDHSLTVQDISQNSPSVAST